MNNAHGTTQVTDEQIITILYLVLQVNCSPSLKEYLHNPVMTHLACNIQRTVSILCAHGVVCACVCVVLCVWMYMHICVLHVHVCVVVYTCALVCAFMCVSAFWMVDTNLQIYLHVPVITQAQNNTHTVLAISIFFLLLHAYNCHNVMSLYVH